MVLGSQSLAVDTDVTWVSEQEPAALWPWVALAQGSYYVLTGVWSLVHIRSFQAVTGPKTDLWLVKTVGVLVIAIGGVLCSAGLRRQATPEIPSLAVGSAVGLAGSTSSMLPGGASHPSICWTRWRNACSHSCGGLHGFAPGGEQVGNPTRVWEANLVHKWEATHDR